MRRPPLATIGAILVAFLVASCAPGGDGAPLSERVQLKVGVLGTTGDAPIYIAFERGYFDEQNIDVEFVRFGSALDMIAPLSSEQLDVGSGGIGAALFNAVSQGIPIKLVAETVRTPEDWTANAWFVRTAIADQVQTPADLRGLTVALASTCTVIDTELGVLLEQGGLTRDDVTIRTVPYADHAAAFANGSIDVTYGFEPFNSTFQQTGVARRWLTGGSVIPNHVQSGIIYGPSITSRPEVARAWMIAYLKGVREAYEHYEELPLPDEIVDILVKHGQQQDRERVATTRLSPRNLDGAIDENSVRTDLDFFSEAGCVENAPSLDEVIDNSYAEHAVEQLGSAQ
ncbi:MAG: ABC transporter substrate-binding protein [Candidatus Limnocylindria bacterium]